MELKPQYDVTIYLLLKFDDETMCTTSASYQSCTNFDELNEILCETAVNIANKVSEEYKQTTASIEFISKSEYERLTDELEALGSTSTTVEVSDYGANVTHT